MWVSDSSKQISTSGNRVSCTIDANAGGDVYNAVWKDNGESDTGLGSGKAYWKVSVEGGAEGDVFVGLTDLQHFKQGWGCKGLMYGGNLSNGGCLLKGDFGPRVKSGDVVGIYADVDGSKIKAYFDVNGRPLGAAFDVPRSTLGNLFPMVHFSGNGACTIAKSDAYPSTTRKEEEFQGLEGHWEYTSGSFDTSGEIITINVRAIDGNAYKGSMRVINNTSVSITRAGPSDPWKGKAGGSTMMAGPPELMTLERDLMEQMTGTFSLNDAGQLNIANGGKTAVWKRSTPAMSPVTEDPFQ